MSPQNQISSDDVKTGVTILGFIATWLSGFFFVGRKTGKYETEMEILKQRLAATDIKLAQDIKDIKALFITNDKEPRYISGVQCGMNREACQILLKERHEGHSEQLKKLFDKMDQVANDIAAIRAKG